MDASIQVLNNTIYDNFARNYGQIETIPDKNLENKYKDHTVKDLKKALKCLKLSTNSDITEIEYVSRVLRDKLRNSNNTQTDTQQDQSFNHDKYFERNFLGYVKNVLASKRTILPSFNMQDCTGYFKKTLVAIHPTKLFRIPSRKPTLSRPQIQYDLDPPTYQQITTIIRKMKASGSPCRQTSKPGPDSYSKKTRTREKPGLVLGLAFEKPGLDSRKPGL